MIRKLIFLISFISPSLCFAQTIAKFEVELPKAMNGIAVPASINLDEITFLSDSALSLVETQPGKQIPIPFQIKQGEPRILYWLIPDSKQKKHSYELINVAQKKFPEIIADIKGSALTFESDKKNFLRYYFKTVYPPQGIDTNYKRSGFIHPLWSPHGQELTRIQPPDHYHHYGIWNPWTHVYFEGDTIDFWNLKDKKGTVRFAGFIFVTNGPVYSEFQAKHEHVVFKKDGTEKIAMNELQTVRVYNPQANSDYFIVDLTSQLNCASGSSVLLMTYRYGGLGWRTTEYWNNDNCEVLTSEGKTRKNTDSSKAKWCIVQGALPENDYGGAVFFSHPANYNHPEPMRIWVKNTNDRGDMFFNFSPTKNKDWLLQPGKTYLLRYRLIVFNGKMDATKAESAWQYFAAPPKVIIKKR